MKTGKGKKYARQNVEWISSRSGAFELIYWNEVVFVGFASNLRSKLEEVREQQKFDVFIIYVTGTVEEAERLCGDLRREKSPRRNKRRK